MRVNKFRIILVILVLSVGFIGSFRMVQAEERSLSLDECLKIALENNKQLLLAQEKVNNSQAKKREAFGSYLPNVSAMGALIYNHELNKVNFLDKEIVLGAKKSYLGKLSFYHP